MSHFLFTTILTALEAGRTMRVAINTDFIVRISDIDLEQSAIALDDGSIEIAQECFDSLTAKLSHDQIGQRVSTEERLSHLMKACTIKPTQGDATS